MNSQPNPYRVLQKISVQAEREVAFQSPDHLVPWGTRKDNSSNRRFNQKLYKLYAPKKGPLWILDMGCSGGGFVKQCLDDGCIAVGLEGSDFSRKFRRAEWRTIPDYLFTTDISGRFKVLGEFEDGTRQMQFDVITCWEVIEHIAEKDLGIVAENVKQHLAPEGLWIMSVSPNVDLVEETHLHQTIQPESWWIDKFRQFNLFHCPEYVRFFNTQFVRGPKYGAPRSFHLVLSADPSKAPVIPPEGMLIRLFDRWLGSLPQRMLKQLLVGV